MADDPNEQRKIHDIKSSDSNETETTQVQHLQLDLGDDLSHNLESSRLGTEVTGSMSTASEAPKREDNPFSFKHFLRSDSNNYQSKGARPKVYCNSSQDPNKLSKPTTAARKVSEFPSALPDFVQDHLVIEQCYLGGNSSNSFNVSENNLPDFAPNRSSKRSNFDLQNSPVHEPNLSIPLDLPGPPHTGFPLDLPISSAPTCSRNGPTLSEVGNSKSLPDFLADSAVCSKKSDPVSPVNSPEGDSERARREVEVLRRQLSEQTRYSESLRRELDFVKNKEQEYTQNLAKALEQVEDNLEKSNRRAESAESTVLKLRQEVKSLKHQLNHRRPENMKGDEAAGGQGYYASPNDIHSQRLAQELRAAASTAEHSLRQLLTGVDNLRIMASTLENINKIEEKSDRFSNFDEGAGPAL